MILAATSAAIFSTESMKTNFNLTNIIIGNLYDYVYNTVSVQSTYILMFCTLVYILYTTQKNEINVHKNLQ